MIITRTHIPRRTVLRGLGATMALPWLDAMVPALAPRALAATPVRRFGAVFVLMDQIAAQEFAKATQLASLELTLEAFALAGNFAGYSCAYNATVSWRTPTTPLRMEATPRAVFERLFGASNTTDAKARLAA